LSQKFRFFASKSFYSDKPFMRIRREYTTKLGKQELAELAILGRLIRLWQNAMQLCPWHMA
jgi:hypothetical protein